MIGSQVLYLAVTLSCGGVKNSLFHMFLSDNFTDIFHVDDIILLAKIHYIFHILKDLYKQYLESTKVFKCG